MRVHAINDEMRSLFERIISFNECGGDPSYAYRFSDPDGVKTGKSGWSFGLCQFDINNNPNALLALREMNFTTDEIAWLKAQNLPEAMEGMNAKLIRNRDIVDKWDRKQLDECLEWSLTLCEEINAEFSSIETFMHIADYHNQFFFSRGGKLYSFLHRQYTEVTPEMIRDFKMTLPWGTKNPADIYRRYMTIARIMRG